MVGLNKHRPAFRRLLQTSVKPDINSYNIVKLCQARTVSYLDNVETFVREVTEVL